MNVSALEIWNKFNHTKILFIRNKNYSYLAFPDDDKLNRQNNEIYNL